MDAPRPTSLTDDTSPEAERVWLEALREKGPAFRLRMVLALSNWSRMAALSAFDRMRPGTTRAERDEWIVRQCYGDEVAARYLACVSRMKPE